MKRAQTDAKEMMAAIGRESGRSSLFWDFYDNHAAMLRAKGVGRFDWRDLTARVAARGLTDVNGNAPDQQTTKKTWHRVCQLKARERAARDKQQHTRNREHERAVNANRPPPAVTASTPAPPVPRYPPPPPTPSAQSALHSRPDASPNAGGAIQTPEEMLADLRATIKRRSQYF